jgi:hypothetical protein
MEKNNDSTDTSSNLSAAEEYIPTSEEKAFINEYVAISKDGVLIKKGSIAVRMFSVSGGGILLAFTFSELTDSFIVGFPAFITSIETNVLAKMMSPVPMVRLYKTGILLSAMPPPKYLLCYLLACRNQLKQMPGFFDDVRSSQVDALIGALQEGLNVTELKKSEVKTGSSPPKATMTISSPAMEFRDYDSPAIIKKPKYRH